MTFTRFERFLLLGIGYVLVIALAVIVWPNDPAPQTPVSAGGWHWPSPSATLTPTSTPSAKKVVVQPQTYVVTAGDSPQTVETKTSFLWSQIYALNTQLIESTARAHGLQSSQDGTYLYVGEALVLPSGH